jgi:anti-anti-sigma factor
MRLQLKSEKSAEIKTSEQGDALVVYLKGQIDEMIADALSTKLDEIFEEGYTRIIFDLNDVLYIGSSGLGQIMRAYRQINGSGGYVRVVNPQPLILDMFHLTKLDKILGIYPTVQDALNSENESEGGL